MEQNGTSRVSAESHCRTTPVPNSVCSMSQSGTAHELRARRTVARHGQSVAGVVLDGQVKWCDTLSNYQHSSSDPDIPVSNTSIYWHQNTS
uniref:Putative e3 ubiquitin protein ligase march5 n=1 Tax=Ixodes ricinus TaxID=34613 RepID=A0A0K8REN6_IXORI